MSDIDDDFYEYSHNMSHILIENSSSSIEEMISLPCAIHKALYNKTIECEDLGSGQASTDEDDRLRTVNPSIRPCGQRTEILAQTVHLMDGFEQRTEIIILRWTSGRIFEHGPSTSWTDLDAGPRL